MDRSTRFIDNYEIILQNGTVGTMGVASIDALMHVLLELTLYYSSMDVMHVTHAEPEIPATNISIFDSKSDKCRRVEMLNKLQFLCHW